MKGIVSLEEMKSGEGDVTNDGKLFPLIAISPEVQLDSLFSQTRRDFLVSCILLYSDFYVVRNSLINIKTFI